MFERNCDGDRTTPPRVKWLVDEQKLLMCPLKIAQENPSLKICVDYGFALDNIPFLEFQELPHWLAEGALIAASVRLALFKKSQIEREREFERAKKR